MSSRSRFAAGRVPEEKVCDCLGDGKARSAFEPEELAGGIELEKDVPVVGCKNDVDGAVVQGEVVHKAQDLFFDVLGKLVRTPVLKHAQTIAAPVVSRARRDL